MLGLHMPIQTADGGQLLSTNEAAGCSSVDLGMVPQRARSCKDLEVELDLLLVKL